MAISQEQRKKLGLPQQDATEHQREKTPSLERIEEGHEIAPDTVANAPKFTVLVTKIQKLVAMLATRTPYILYFYVLCDKIKLEGR